MTLFTCSFRAMTNVHDPAIQPIATCLAHISRVVLYNLLQQRYKMLLRVLRFGFLRLPSFSIEFSTGTSALNPFLRREVQHDESQLTGMANQVHEMFPQVPLDAVMEDLRMSGSSQATIENILEGRAGFIASIDGMRPWRTNGEPAENADLLFDDDDESSSDDVVSSSDSTITNSPPQHSASDMSVVNQQMDTDISPYHVAKREMIAKHRRMYIESEKGRDLREKGF